MGGCIGKVVSEQLPDFIDIARFSALGHILRDNSDLASLCKLGKVHVLAHRTAVDFLNVRLVIVLDGQLQTSVISESSTAATALQKHHVTRSKSALYHGRRSGISFSSQEKYFATNVCRNSEQGSAILLFPSSDSSIAFNKRYQYSAGVNVLNYTHTTRIVCFDADDLEAFFRERTHLRSNMLRSLCKTPFPDIVKHSKLFNNLTDEQVRKLDISIG